MSDLDSVNCEYMSEPWGNLINTAIRTSTDKLVNCQCSREYVGFDVDVSNSMEKLRQQICDQKLDGRAAITSGRTSALPVPVHVLWRTSATIFSQHLKLEEKQHEFQLEIPPLGNVVMITRWIR
jgi:hypothetical protein